uniref:F-box only protein 6-like n=1 Tax=Monopterus albus TaxID=43700 RepID=UPI0009B4DD23|nr:F-box only protein 6-like [Monopterus albus]
MMRKAKAMGSQVSSATKPSTSLPNEDLFPIPLEILEEIFLNLPPYQVIHVCRFVSHQWKDVADSESLWRERCKREGYHLHDVSRTPQDWRLFYFLCKKRRNLLKNPRAERNKPQSQLIPCLCCTRYAPRWDCASEYEICVELLDSSKNPVKVFAPDKVCFEQWGSQQWNEMTHVFRDYGPGVRYIRFTHGGQDRQFWAGWYGIRVTDSCVEICPAVDT